MDRAFAVIAVVLIGWMLYATHQRNNVWRSDTALWEDAIRKSPDKERPRHNLSLAYFRRNQWLESLSVDLEAMRELPNPNHEFYQRAGTSLMKLERWDEAHQMFRRAISVADTSQSWQNLAASYLQRWAVVEPKNRDFLVAAKFAYGESRSRDTSNMWALDGLADTVFYLGEGTATFETFRSADATTVNDAYILGKLFINNKQFAQAHEVMQSVQKTGKDTVLVHFYDGYALYALGRFHEAAEQYRMALRIDPASADIELSLKSALKMAGEP